MNPQPVKCRHVFIRIDAVKKRLVQPYDKPFEVVRRFEKFMDVSINGKVQRISIECIKPAFTADKGKSEHPRLDNKTKIHCQDTGPDC